MTASMKTYHCPVEVRGYELDGFGHVNHAVYFNYLEHARWQALKQEGVTITTFNEAKRWPVIAAVEGLYLKPTYLADELLVETRVIEHKKTQFQVEQVITRAGTPVFTAKLRVVVVDENGRPAELPPDLHKLWTEAAQ